MHQNSGLDRPASFDPDAEVHRSELTAILERFWLGYLEAIRLNGAGKAASLPEELVTLVSRTAKGSDAATRGFIVETCKQELNRLNAEYRLSPVVQLRRLEGLPELYPPYSVAERPILKACLEKTWADILWAFVKKPEQISREMKNLDRLVIAARDAPGVPAAMRDETMQAFRTERNNLRLEFVSDPDGQRSRLRARGFSVPPSTHRGGVDLALRTAFACSLQGSQFGRPAILRFGNVDSRRFRRLPWGGMAGRLPVVLDGWIKSFQ
jgi:hypothetical protein